MIQPMNLGVTRIKCHNHIVPPRRVRCYRNLHKKCFSVVDTKTNRVFKHQFHVVLRDARFTVREAGRQRVLREKRKNVHAFVKGELVETNFQFPDCVPKEAWYNPYETEKFVDKETGEVVDRARLVLLSPGHIYYWD